MEEIKKTKELIQEDIGLFEKLFNFIVGRKADSQRPALKAIQKQLNKTGYKYYNLRKEKILPDFARLVFHIYEAVAPLREFFLLRNEESFYENIVIHSYLTEDQIKMEEYISEDSIMEASKRMSFADLQKNCEKAFSILKKEFTEDNVAKIISMNSALVILRHFCVFDFYAMLKKFCLDLKENDFVEVPKFSAMSKEYFEASVFDLLNNIENLLSVEDWSDQIDFISHISGYKEFDVQKFYATFDLIKKLNSVGVFSKFAKLFFHDPKYEMVIMTSKKDIIKLFLEERSQLLKGFISDVYAVKLSERIESLKESLFGSTILLQLKNYNEEFSETLLAAKSPVGFTHNLHIMYLHNFLTTVLSPLVSSFVDVFGIRAVADSKYTTQMTSEFHTLQELDGEIIRLDNQLGPSFPRGYKLIGMLDNKGKSEILSKMESEVNTINAEFNKILSQALVLFKLLDDKVKALQSDANAPNHRILKNWDELEQYFTTPVISYLTDISDDIDNFVSLIDCYN